MANRLPLRYLRLFLFLVGGVSQLAFLAAIMPEPWINEISEELLPQPFPQAAVAFYLARHLSLMYGFVGVALLYIATRLPRYRELIGPLAGCTMVFGVLQGVIDFQSGLPPWWTWGESLSTVAGGLAMMWLHRRCSDSEPQTVSPADDQRNT